jgi:hypothetical protein
VIAWHGRNGRGGKGLVIKSEREISGGRQLNDATLCIVHK